MNAHVVLVAAFALAAVSCSSNKAPSTSAGAPSTERVSVGSDFRLPWHHEAALADTPYRIRFSDVVEDSRCAPDVQCVWAGRVRVALALTLEGSAPVVDTLALGPDVQRAMMRYGALTVRFVGYEPAAARSTESRPAEKAVALLRVERSGE